MKTAHQPAGQGRAYWVVGDRYTILTSGDETNGAFALMHALVPPGGGPPPHVHSREDEAFYILEGELSFLADGRSFRVGAGDWITLAKGSVHAFKNEGSTPARMLIAVTPAGLERFFAEVGTEATDGDSALLLATAPRYGMEIRIPG